MSAQISVNEMAESLTGFEEIAIEQHMGIDIYADAEQKGVKALRALVFVHLTRGGQNAHEAKQSAMGMTLRECNAYFQAEEDEVEPEEPVTEVGKDASQPA
jgi:O6-methylguanine-DNA--protein-cysteine methyltransferase